MQSDGENSIALATSQEDITKRLEALNRWQDEQKRLLEQRQNNQRVMLGMEQRNMYQLLGLVHKEVDSAESSVFEESDVENDGQQEEHVSIQMPRHTEYQEEVGDDAMGDSQQPAKPKRPFLRRGEGLKQRFKINPDQLRLGNLPRYKFANAHPQFRTPTQKKGILKTRQEVKKVTTAQPPTQAPAPAPALLSYPPDANEQRFQKLLISSKTACNSTPDLKSSYASSSTTSVSPRVRFAEQRSREHAADDEHSSEASPLTGVCWAKVLNTQSIKPVPLIQRRTAQLRVDDDSNVSIFELLEQKALEGNFDMNSSCIRTFMARKEQRRQTADDTDQIVVTQQVRQMHLQPEVAQITEINDDDDDDDDDEVEEDQTSDLTMTPLQVGKNQVRVRFSDSNDTHDTTLGDGSNVQLFEQFKSALFQALEQKNKSTAQSKSADEPFTKELQEKANLVRTRLEELETEIGKFKKQNMELIRLKQQHELEKAKCAQDHLEAMDRVHDEKIQAEIYLHDERMKIEEERRKFDQQMRLQKSNVNSKEKKEIAALKQEVEALELQLKQKEQTHISAQARLRAQLRAGEKEQRLLRDEIELLGKENKRLEQELIKVSRENNSKMLQEINRNIARLAPKVLPPTDSAQPIDENGRRTKSLDGPPSKGTAKQRESMSRRQSSGNVPTRGQSSGYGQPNRNRTPKKKPEVVDESYPSSSASDDEDEEEPQAETQAVAEAKSTVEPAAAADFKREIVNADGSKDIWYPNGNLKKISADAMTVRMLYFNKDIKESDIREGTVKYYYAETNTWHTTYLDGLEILEFPNGQTEHRHKDGTIEIRFPNNTIKMVDPSDAEVQEEWRYADGTRLVQLRNGDKVLNLPNGQKEIHTKLNKRREYPDGTVKLVYPDGSQETRYSNGRVRLKDKDGKLIMDTDYAKY
ncbi:centromere protein J [Drosophila pseudoobscura]|uniref:Centromere protein J n=1 Tax=Drosophila pseudoobscura pseudoobscura TaxID=46245 RepID=A0A6I8V3G8_DROPS|nr:centromere protein J [Drosophila pseudoobscura]